MDIGRKITDLKEMENVPAGSSLLIEAGDGSGTKQIKHEKLVEEVGKGLKLGNLKELDTESKGSIVGALNEVNEKAGTVFKGTDSIAAGTAGLVPAPRPEDDGNVLGANGKWVLVGGGGIIEGITEDLNCENPKIAAAVTAVKKINDSLDDIPVFITDESGKITGYKTKAGADTVFPFSSENHSPHTIKLNHDTRNGFTYVSIDGQYVTTMSGNNEWSKTVYW